MPHKIDLSLRPDLDLKVANQTEMPANYFETLTFGKLEIGQKFISFPVPGDNNNHGGFKGAHYIFTKVNHNKAVNNKGISTDFPDSMPVILVE